MPATFSLAKALFAAFFWCALLGSPFLTHAQYSNETPPTGPQFMYSVGADAGRIFGVALNDPGTGVASDVGPVALRVKTYGLEFRGHYHVLRVRRGIWGSLDAGINVDLGVKSATESSRSDTYLALKYSMMPTLYLGGVTTPDGANPAGLFVGGGPIITRIPWVNENNEDDLTMRMAWGVRLGYASGQDTGLDLRGGILAFTYSPGFGELYTDWSNDQEVKAGSQFTFSYTLLFDQLR